MSEVSGPDTQPLLTAGAMIRAARQAQGLHAAALATQLKITPRKLEALENDQFEDLQGPTFVRALAQAACRALKIDPVPVLARLPAIQVSTLEQVSGGLNAPFREPGGHAGPLEWVKASRWPLAAVAVLLIGALLLWLLPPGMGLSPWSAASSPPALTEAGASAVPSDEGPVPSEAPLPRAEVASAAVAQAASSAAPAPVDSQMVLQVTAREASWVEVTDAGGRSLIARTLAAGEAVGLEGEFPLRVKVGNAAGTVVLLRGQPVDLMPATRDNIARLELK